MMTITMPLTLRCFCNKVNRTLTGSIIYTVSSNVEIALVDRRSRDTEMLHTSAIIFCNNNSNNGGNFERESYDLRDISSSYALRDAIFINLPILCVSSSGRRGSVEQWADFSLFFLPFSSLSLSLSFLSLPGWIIAAVVARLAERVLQLGDLRKASAGYKASERSFLSLPPPLSLSLSIARSRSSRKKPGVRVCIPRCTARHGTHRRGRSSSRNKMSRDAADSALRARKRADQLSVNAQVARRTGRGYAKR